MGFLLLIARILFSAIFITSGFNHVTNVNQMSQYAASKHVPLPKFSVFISGILLLLGGFSVLLGFLVSIGAWLLIIFLLPAAFMMHNYWTIEDPEAKQHDQIHFYKDLALVGAAFLIWYLYTYSGHVPWSIS